MLIFAVAPLKRVFIAASISALIMPAPLAQPDRQQDQKTWRIVVLNNADFLLPASAIMDQALREQLTREAPQSVEFFAEVLDSIRHPGTVNDALYGLLRRKYEKVNVDLVMARGRGSIDFVRSYGNDLWPNVPVVFYNESPESLSSRPALPNSTGALVEIDAASTIDLALRLHPGARNIYVIAGTSEYDKGWKRRVSALLSKLTDRYTVTWLDRLPMSKILETVSGLPSGSIVLYTSVLLDAEGKTRTNPQVAAQVAAASAAPVYGYLETYFGAGVVGGAIPDFAAHGRTAAELALRVLNGEPVSTIRVLPASPAKCVVDDRALSRFNIDQKLLPGDCEVRFRAPSLWRDYRWYVLAALAAIALQSLLIAALVAQRRRRRLAELAAHQQSVELAHTLRLATVGEMTAAISHEINQPLGAILGNADAAEMLLESDSHSIDQLRHILADIRRDDLRASEVVKRLRAFLQKQEVEKKTFDLNELIADTLRLVEGERARRSVKLDVQTVPGSVLVSGDRIRLQQLLINLIINAMDAMEETSVDERKVRLQLYRPNPGKVEIAVIDTGHGIEVGASDRVFDSFYTTKPKGLGLGLSIARTIVEAHGGSIRAEHNLSGGAIFRVTLPEAEPEPARSSVSVRTAQAGAE